MLKLKLQHFGHLTQRTDSFEKTLKLGNLTDRGAWGVTVHAVTEESVMTEAT